MVPGLGYLGTGSGLMPPGYAVYNFLQYIFLEKFKLKYRIYRI